MTQQESAERAVRTLCQAVIDQDLGGLKRACPLCRNMGDEFLRAIVFKPGKDTRIVEIVGIGRILKTGRSPLGPLVAIPATLRLQNGTKLEEKRSCSSASLATGFPAWCMAPGGKRGGSSDATRLVAMSAGK